jgi:hypothetical protein
MVVRQEEMARLIGMTRSSLQRALKGLAESGAISSGYGCIVVQDRGWLERVRDEA